MIFIYFLAGLIILGFFLNWLSYRYLKAKYLKADKFDLNICCGQTACDGVNVDIVKRDVPGFVLVNDIYHLPFEDKQFKKTICSHTLEHVEDADAFFHELERVSQELTILIPPLWDFSCMLNLIEHKRQFLTLKSRHKNFLPRYFKLPLAAVIQKTFGQKING